MNYNTKDMQNDKKIALEAVKKDTYALKYVPKDIQGYDELKLLANLSENKDEKENTRKVK